MSADERKQAVRDFAERQQRSSEEAPDFPKNWDVSVSGSGRVRRLTYEPSSPIEFADAKAAVSAFMDAL